MSLLAIVEEIWRIQGHARDTRSWVQILSFSCSCQQNNCKILGQHIQFGSWHPTQENLDLPLISAVQSYAHTFLHTMLLFCSLTPPTIKLITCSGLHFYRQLIVMLYRRYCHMELCSMFVVNAHR